MKSFSGILCLLAALMLVALLAFQAAADRPRRKEIRDKVMWGDPDSPAGCRSLDNWQVVTHTSQDREDPVWPPHDPSFQVEQPVTISAGFVGLQFYCLDNQGIFISEIVGKGKRNRR